jgi:hypothetical protein
VFLGAGQNALADPGLEYLFKHIDDFIFGIRHKVFEGEGKFLAGEGGNIVYFETFEVGHDVIVEEASFEAVEGRLILFPFPLFLLEVWSANIKEAGGNFMEHGVFLIAGVFTKRLIFLSPDNSAFPVFFPAGKRREYPFIASPSVADLEFAGVLAP